MNNAELISQTRELCDAEFNLGKLNATLMRDICDICDALEAAEKEANHADD